ncbi:MAG TPA: DUF58 domain-containing protein [Methylomirabilota bacterium]|nr:DUF58 domain-containing protein [Methylomirabilota bacterium]
MRRAAYRTFSAAHALESRFARRCTPAGRLVIAALFASMIIGPNTRLTVAYQAFTFLLALLLIAVALSVRRPPRLSVRRALPRFATAGVPFVYRLRVGHAGQRLERGLLLTEELADPRPSLAEFLSAVEPGEERRNRFDRAVGYPRWAWLVSRNRRARIVEQPLPPLPPGTEIEVRVEVTPRARGSLRFAGVTVARPDPLALMKSPLVLDLPGSVLVLPRRYPLPAIELPGARRYQHGGIALASSVGDSEEFLSLREYRPGDPLRRIHWRSWARAGVPIVKEYQDEFFVRHGLILDTFVTGAVGPRFEEAVSVAASFAAVVDTHESLLDLMFVGAQTYCFTAGRGVGQADRMLEVLAGVTPCQAHPFSTLSGLVLERRAALSGCICVLLAWDDERRRLVDTLRAHGVPTLVLVVDDAPAAAPAPDEAGIHRLVPGRIAEGLARL